MVTNKTIIQNIHGWPDISSMFNKNWNCFYAYSPLVSFQSIINCARVISWKVEGFKLFKGKGNDISNNTSFSLRGMGEKIDLEQTGHAKVSKGTVVISGFSWKINSIVLFAAEPVSWILNFIIEILLKW